MDFTAGLMPLDTALAQMLDRITPLNATETVPLLQAFSRVTAHDIVSPLDVPGFDNAAMDGYAVRLNDLRDGAALPVAGKAFAGQPFNDAWPSGTCIRIMTGAPVPEGCDALVMQEETEQTEADVVISSGGVSVGEADYTKTILEELGEIGFWKLAIKPGKPFAFGKLSSSWFCGLPGNPVSATVTFCQLVQPLLAKLSGKHGPLQAPRLRVRAATRLKKSPGRLDFQRGILQRNPDGELVVNTTGHQGSHIFSSFSLGNCFIVLERERGHVEAGEWVEVEPFSHLFGGL
ncbi:TPA: hypothetical protein OL850_002034 [Klebsiella pneumoniae]|nr:hypothetical protein [Klebsiella pneumoniae]